MAEGSGCTPGLGALADGRWFGFVEAADVDGLDFDLACYFVGKAAIAAADEDGAESPPPNDYYVRNVNTKMRSLAIAPSASVVWYPNAGDPASRTTTTYGKWLAETADRPDGPGVWLKVSNGAVVSVEEQWVP